MGVTDNHIKEMRSEKGMRQEDLAEAIGVTRQTIIAMEKGGYVPSLELALRLSRLFGVSVEELFDYEQ